MAECESEVLVEEVLEELAHADVRPAAVDEQQALEEAELSQGVVARHHRLHALLTTDAHSDVCHYKHTTPALPNSTRVTRSVVCVSARA